MEKEILYTTTLKEVFAHIPKKRDEGFLRYPVFTQENGISKKMSEICGCECCGLDGYLSIYRHPRQLIDSNLIVKTLEEHYGYKAREIEWDTFFDIVDNISSR